MKHLASATTTTTTTTTETTTTPPTTTTTTILADGSTGGGGGVGGGGGGGGSSGGSDSASGGSGTPGGDRNGGGGSGGGCAGGGGEVAEKEERPPASETVEPTAAFDVASLVLYGSRALPIRLKILLDQLFNQLPPRASDTYPSCLRLDPRGLYARIHTAGELTCRIYSTHTNTRIQVTHIYAYRRLCVRDEPRETPLHRGETSRSRTT